MKKLNLLILVALAAASVAMAQTAGNDVLGAHNGYGRGCVMCHAPHGGSFGNGTGATGNNADPNNGVIALWGQNIAPYYNLQTAFSGDGKAKYPVTLPANALAGAHDANTVILLCLSCHDGSIAQVSMMQGTTVETLPVVGGHAPTLFGTTPGNKSTYYANEHPVGGFAVVGCGGGHNWDCAGGDTNTSPTKGGAAVTGTVNPGPQITMTGTASSAFVANNPSSFWNNWSYTGTVTAYNTCLITSGCGFSNPLASFSNTGTINGVGCTTCHDQHSMTRYTNSTGSYSTMFFIRGQYTPLAGGNAVAQFCRNCHGGESNEMNGLMNIPTT
jgi:cytochrome c553